MHEKRPVDLPAGAKRSADRQRLLPHGICLTLIGVLCALVTGTLTVLCLRYQASVSMDIEEMVTLRQNPVWTTLLLSAGLLLLIMILQPLLRRVPEWGLFLAGTLLYLMAGFILIRFAGRQIRMDQHYVYENALRFMEGDYEGLLPNKYLGWNPHQLGLLTWERLLLGLYPGTQILFYANLLLCIGINYFQWQSTRILSGGNARVCRNEILLSFAFLPQFFFILFAYGQIPGLFFAEAGVLLLLLWEKKGQVMALLPGGILCLAAAALIKPNYGIAVIAVCLLLFLGFLQKRRKELLVGLILLIVTALAGKPLLYRYYERESGMEIPGGIPMVSYFVMGLMETEGKPCNNGWSNEYNLEVYAGNGFDSEAAAREARGDLSRRIAELGGDPGYAADFFKGKVLSTWCDPLFQAVWSGPKASMDQDIDTQLLRDFFEGKSFYPTVADGMNLFVILIFAGCTAFLGGLLFSRKRRAPADPLLLLPALYFLGGFLYHLLSETKSQYVYMYVFCMIPYLAAVLTAGASAAATFIHTKAPGGRK